ncbi:MAG: endonuclease/exonuclease/phosphatase family protein [Bacteroidota bacterium]
MAVNLLFLGYWTLRWKRAAWISLVAIALGWVPLQNLFQFPGFTAADDGGFKVMSYNVRVFDLYKWTENTKSRNAILGVLQEEAPDVLCVQEFFHTPVKNYFTTLDTIVQLIPARQVHTEYTKTVKQHYHFGIATFSRFPIVGKGKVDLGESGNNVCIYSDLLVDSDTIRVYNMHLASIHFGQREYQFVEQLGESQQEERLAGARNIYKLLEIAFKKRAHQADAIRAHLETSPHPVVVCGDFNDTPSSYAYRTIRQELSDAFCESGSGFGQTYNGQLPFLRIDYLLHDPALRSHSFRTVEKTFSDHYAITSRIVPPSDLE